MDGMGRPMMVVGIYAGDEEVLVVQAVEDRAGGQRESALGDVPSVVGNAREGRVARRRSS